MADPRAGVLQRPRAAGAAAPVVRLAGRLPARRRAGCARRRPRGRSQPGRRGGCPGGPGGGGCPGGSGGGGCPGGSGGGGRPGTRVGRRQRARPLRQHAARRRQDRPHRHGRRCQPQSRGTDRRARGKSRARHHPELVPGSAVRGATAARWADEGPQLLHRRADHSGGVGRPGSSAGTADRPLRVIGDRYRDGLGLLRMGTHAGAGYLGLQRGGGHAGGDVVP